ncbi:Progesterone-induced-blocking factor 1 [Chamberlinius hualienensis]
MSSSQPSTSSTTTLTSNFTTDSELKSEELSGIETTVPTDMTLSPESDVGRFSRPNAVTKQLLERKQLLHDLQLLKIELSQKNLIIDNLKADFMNRMEEIEEKFADAVHARQMTQAMMEAKLNIQSDDMKQKLEAGKLEIARISKNYKELEEKYAILADKSSNDRRLLYSLELKEEEFLDLQKKDPESLSLRDHLSLKTYEVVWPYKSELESTKNKISTLTETNQRLKEENDHLTEVLNAESKKATHYQLKFTEQKNSVKDLELQLKSDDFKINHYDQLKNERDKYFEDVCEFRKKMSVFEATNAAFSNENSSLKSENVSLHQKSCLMQQDKDYLYGRLQELSTQKKVLDDQVSKLNLQLEKMTIAREEIYEKYVSARDIYKSEFDRKLKEELDAIQGKTMSEIELLRRTSRDVYEHEIRSLKDARDIAITEKMSAETALRQNSEKCEKYLDEIHLLKGGGDSELLNLRNQLLLKCFEVEQLKLVSSETQKSYKTCQLENEKQLKKIELFESELKTIEIETGKKISDLESKLAAANQKLSSYEALENDLDEAVMDAAQVGEGHVVSSFGEAANITTSVKRRLQHSFQLAKRILVLEKLNAQLKREIDGEKKRSAELTEEFENCTRLLNDLDKPNSYLVDSIRSRDKFIKQQQEKIEEFENESEHLKSEKEDLRKRIELLTVDMENVLRNREEIVKMKKLLTSFFPQLAIKGPDIQRKSPVTKKILPKLKAGPSKFR